MAELQRDVENTIYRALAKFEGRPLMKVLAEEMADAVREEIFAEYGPFETDQDGELYYAEASKYAIGVGHIALVPATGRLSDDAAQRLHRR